MNYEFLPPQASAKFDSPMNIPCIALYLSIHFPYVSVFSSFRHFLLVKNETNLVFMLFKIPQTMLHFFSFTLKFVITVSNTIEMSSICAPKEKTAGLYYTLPSI